MDFTFVAQDHTLKENGLMDVYDQLLHPMALPSVLNLAYIPFLTKKDKGMQV